MSSFAPSPLALRHVTIRYNRRALAIRDLSLDVPPGEVFGLVGPNGAGKSSLLNCAAGLLSPLSGTVTLGGEEVTGRARAAARHLCLMPDPLGVYLDVTAGEYLDFFARAAGADAAERRRRIARAVERMELEPWLDHEVEALSAGWQRRLALSRVLLADAPIVLLDEPAAGMDVAARGELLRIVRGFAAEGRAVMVTSHILPELEELADRFAIIRRGEWVPVQGRTFFSRADLRGGFGQGAWHLECSEPEAARALLGPERLAPEPGSARLRLSAADREEAAACVARLAAAGHRIYHFEAVSSSLGEITLEALREASRT